MKLDQTALLLIDLQNEEGTSEIANIEEIIQNTRKMIETCRKKDIPVIYTRHINQGNGIGLANKEPVNEKGEPIYYHSDTNKIEIIEQIKPDAKDIVIDKYRYSGFYESNLELMLKSLGVKHLIVGGVLTDCCVMSTVVDAYYRDYQVNLVKDMCGTTTEGAHMASILIMGNWVYDLEIYETEQMINRVQGARYSAWKSSEPDELQFSPDNMKKVFSRISGIESVQML